MSVRNNYETGGDTSVLSKEEIEYQKKVAQLVDAGYTEQEAKDKVDFDTEYAKVLDESAVEEPAQEEPLVEEPFIEEEEVILPVVPNKFGKTDDSLRVRGRDGNIWDGTGTITVGTTTYNADAREVHVSEVAPVMTSKSEIIGILNIGSSFDALGWTRGFPYKGDERYWVDTYDNRIPVRSTSEKPV